MQKENKQYTLIYIDNPDKIVRMTTFLDIDHLKDYKNFTINSPTSDLIPVDADGYVWFFEDENPYEEY